MASALLAGAFILLGIDFRMEGMLFSFYLPVLELIDSGGSC